MMCHKEKNRLHSRVVVGAGTKKYANHKMRVIECQYYKRANIVKTLVLSEIK